MLDKTYRPAEVEATLTAQIQDSEQRSQSALHEQVQTLIHRSREGSERLKSKFIAHEHQLANLTTQLEIMGKDLVRTLKESHAEVRAVLQKLESEQQSLAVRLTELEKPRGLRALWLRLFGRRNAKPAKSVVAA